MLQAGHCRELGASIYELAHVANLAQDGSSGLASSSHTYFFSHPPPLGNSPCVTVDIKLCLCVTPNPRLGCLTWVGVYSL